MEKVGWDSIMISLNENKGQMTKLRERIFTTTVYYREVENMQNLFWKLMRLPPNGLTITAKFVCFA